MVLFSIDAYSQTTSKDNVYVPRRVSSGNGLDSAMTSIIANISTLDTTAAVTIANYKNVYIVLSQATGTAGGLIVKYQGSTDGVNFGTNVITIDSLNWTAATAKKAFALPGGGLGFNAVRFIIAGSTGPAFTGVNRYSVQIRRKP